jgi:general secretion pathway protein M
VPTLEGATDALAGATLQQSVQAIAAKAGASLASTEALPAEAAGAYRRIGLRISVNSPLPVLVQMLSAIGDAQPRMLVNDLHIQATRGLVPDPAAPLSASFVVAAFRAGGA